MGITYKLKTLPWHAYPIGTKAKQAGGSVFTKCAEGWRLENGALFVWPCNCDLVMEE